MRTSQSQETDDAVQLVEETSGGAFSYQHAQSDFASRFLRRRISDDKVAMIKMSTIVDVAEPKI